MDTMSRIESIPSDWGNRHNYRGIYDMVYAHERSHRNVDVMVCSVFDTIQVWDVNSKCLLNLIKGRQLDFDGRSSTCFSVTHDGTRLVCGTNLNKIHVLDLFSGDLMESHFVAGRDFDGLNVSIVDVRCGGASLMAVDRSGKLYRWRVDGRTMRHERSFYPPFEGSPREEEEEPEVVNSAFDLKRSYTERQVARLLDYDRDLVAVTSRHWLCVASLKNVASATFERILEETLCCKLRGNSVYCGSRVGTIAKYSLREDSHSGFYVNASPKSLTFRKQVTRFEDSVTSLDVSADGSLLIAGDVNGEVHGFLTDDDKFGTTEKCHVFTLDTAHSYGSYVWALHMDEARIFSGDSDGKLVIHDFWDYEARSAEDVGECVPAKVKRHS